MLQGTAIAFLRMPCVLRKGRDGGLSFCKMVSMRELEALKEHRRSLLADGINATFEVPLRFTKSFVGEYTDSFGEKRKGKIIEGIASTEAEDQQGEVVLQEKMDCSYLIEKGYLNWNHSHAPEDQIGKPLEVIKMEGGPETPNNRPCTFFRALLLEGVPRADAVWNLAKSLENTHGVGNNRSLGFSVEGGVRVRQGNILVETVVRHMAATHEPVNAQAVARCVLAKSQGFRVQENVLLDTLDDNVPHLIFKSYSQMVKSIMVGESSTGLSTGDMQAGLLENLHGISDMKNFGKLAESSVDHAKIVNELYNPCTNGRECRPNGKFAGGPQGALTHLVECRGMAPKAAADSMIVVVRELRKHKKHTGR
jgi:hypothetical protein